MIVLAIALGGGLGAGLRWLADSALPRPAGFPVGITAVNIVGSLVLGMVVGLGVAEGTAWVAALTVGVLGGFTTFSTWMVDIEQAPTSTTSLAIAVAPLGAGLAAAALGIVIGTALA